jgi:glycosyltransferase involved in cell wall biosynthesis/thioredoxin-like negative regulator of GroEL
MKISIIIPTHNRAGSLRETIDSLLALRGEASFEIVVVDNNSTDNTRTVVESYGEIARYVFESRTAFTKARSTGGEHSRGDILLYLDDDVLVFPGSLRQIVEVFQQYPDCGVIAGRIDPKYTDTPPAWTLACQKSFNGWSLFNPETYSIIGHSFQEVPSACGPMMAIRRTAYQRVGGFPPDTIGVETNTGARSFRKLYIGPGDYGLCLRIREAGFKVYYTPEVGSYHVIPPIRFTPEFWRSRMIGEGHYVAIADRSFFKATPVQLFLKRQRAHLEFFSYKQLLKRDLAGAESTTGRGFSGLLPEELWVRYYAAYLEMDAVLRKHPDLPPFLWNLAAEGVADNNFDEVIRRLPQEYKDLVNSDHVYDSAPLDNLMGYRRLMSGLTTEVQRDCEQMEAFINHCYHLLQQDPRNLDLLDLFRSAEHSESARKVIEAALQVEPRNGHLFKWLGASYSEAGQELAAKECLERAVRQLPHDSEAGQMIKQFQPRPISAKVAPGLNSPRQPSQTFQEATAFMREREFARGLLKLDEMMQSYPDFPRLQYSRACCLLALNRPSEARQLLEQKLRENPQDAESQALLERVSLALEYSEARPPKASHGNEVCSPVDSAKTVPISKVGNPSRLDAVRQRIALKKQAAGVIGLPREAAPPPTRPVSLPTAPEVTVSARSDSSAVLGAERLSCLTRSTTKPQQVSLFMQYRNLVRQAATLPLVSDTGFRVLSQSDEDGILLFLFAVLGTGSKVFVDIGTSSAIESNCANLAFNFGWHGLFVRGSEAAVAAGRDIFHNHPDTRVFPPIFKAASVTREGVNQILQDAGMAGEIDLLSLDIGGMDYWIWEVMDSVRPRVVLLRANGEFGGEHAITVPYRPDFSISHAKPHYQGASLPALVKLGRRKGYRLVGTNRFGCNAFFVRTDCAAALLSEVSVDTCRQHFCRRSDASIASSMQGLPFVEV